LLLWLSIIAAVGCRSRPRCCRACSTSRRFTAAQVPSCVHLSKVSVQPRL
jgi:hypothetical protein